MNNIPLHNAIRNARNIMKIVKNTITAFLFVTYLTLLNAEAPVEKKDIDPKKVASVTLYNETFAGTITVKRLKELLVQGADINYEEPDGTRPLDRALLNRNVAVAHEMQKRGAHATQIGLRIALSRVVTMHLVGATAHALEIVKDFKKAGIPQLPEEYMRALKTLHANDGYVCKKQAQKPGKETTMACDSHRLLSIVFGILEIKPDETIEVVRVN